MPKISALPPMTTPIASGDDMPIVDESDGTTKRVSTGELVGFPDYGWTSAITSWSYSSWTAGTQIGVITVPTDATTIYSVGMRIKISQSTGGTKYGIITKVAATALTVFFPTGTTLNNEAISTPFYSSVKIPFGFPLDPTLWTLTKSLASDRSTAATTFTSLTDTLALGIGSWLVDVKYPSTIVTGGTNRTGFLTISTGSTETNPEFTAMLRSTATSATGQGSSTQTRGILTLAAATTLTLMGKTQNADSTITVNVTQMGAGYIRAICAYL